MYLTLVENSVKKDHLNNSVFQLWICAITEDIIPLCRETAASWVKHHEEGIEDELVAIIYSLIIGMCRLKGGAIKLFGARRGFQYRSEVMNNDRMKT